MANVCGADIRKIENLQDCANLQELNLSGNEISSIEGLERLHHLRKLVLTSNQIESLEGLQVHMYLLVLCLFRRLSTQKEPAACSRGHQTLAETCTSVCISSSAHACSLLQSSHVWWLAHIRTNTCARAAHAQTPAHKHTCVCARTHTHKHNTEKMSHTVL
jgi:hypothetical protein